MHAFGFTLDLLGNVHFGDRDILPLPLISLESGNGKFWNIDILTNGYTKQRLSIARHQSKTVVLGK